MGNVVRSDERIQMSDQSPRTNAARLPEFVGRIVRLPCKVLNQHAGAAIVEACDGGQVNIQMSENDQLEGTFVEIIGKVLDESNIKLLRGLNLDSDKELDMNLVNDVIELTFDPRFKKIFPS
ncbi:replication factor A protein 3 [Boletus edulis]|nr:replication factor A protein 3 [Boletus edulis]